MRIFIFGGCSTLLFACAQSVTNADVPVQIDVAAEDTVAPMCQVVDVPQPVTIGFCDNAGPICTEWAQLRVRDAGVAYSACLEPSMRNPTGVRCQRASMCPTTRSAPADCKCGNGPPCNGNEMCVADTPTSVPTCRCLRPIQ